jgi:hypothetical protein
MEHGVNDQEDAYRQSGPFAQLLIGAGNQGYQYSKKRDMEQQERIDCKVVGQGTNYWKQSPFMVADCIHLMCE